MPASVYVCKYLQNLGYPHIIWGIPVLMTCSYIFLDIPKLNKNRLGRDIQITQTVTYFGKSKDKYVYPDLYQPVVFRFSPLEKRQTGINQV